MPAFGKRRTGRRRLLTGPDNDTSHHRIATAAGCGALWRRHCSALARHAIIRTSGDATRAQRDTGGSMSADHGRQTASAGTHEPSPGQAEPLYGGQASRRLTIRDVAAAKARGEKWPMLTAYDALTAAV